MKLKLRKTFQFEAARLLLLLLPEVHHAGN